MDVEFYNMLMGEKSEFLFMDLSFNEIGGMLFEFLVEM